MSQQSFCASQPPSQLSPALTLSMLSPRTRTLQHVSFALDSASRATRSTAASAAAPASATRVGTGP